MPDRPVALARLLVLIGATISVVASISLWFGGSKRAERTLAVLETARSKSSGGHWPAA
jgi:hypothetical protein